MSEHGSRKDAKTEGTKDAKNAKGKRCKEAKEPKKQRSKDAKMQRCKDAKMQRRRGAEAQRRRGGTALPCFSNTTRGSMQSGLPSDGFEKLGRVVTDTVFEDQLYLFHIADVRGRIAIDHYEVGLLSHAD